MKIVENRYGKYAIPSSLNLGNCQVYDKLSKGKVWEERTLQFIENHIDNKSMVHAGTYLGDMLPALSKSTSGTIFAFEPNPYFIDCVKKTIELNNLNNISLFNKGLGEVESKGNLIYEYKNGVSLGGGSRIEHSEQRNDRYTSEENKRIEIDIVSIDTFINEEISILQLDIEGFEMNVLKGAIKTIKKYKPILILERVDGTEQFMDTIMNLGYRKINSMEHNTFWKCDTSK